MALTKRQLEMRRAGIGASEIAVLAGLSRYSSPIAIYEAKVTGKNIESTYAMEFGNELEAPIARAWAKLNHRSIARVDTLTHPAKPYAMATPDRAVYLTPEARGDGRALRQDVRDAEELLQVKSTNWRQRHLWGPEGTDAIPDEYLCQAHWEGSVAGLSRVRFAVDFDKTSLHEWVVQVSPEVFEALYAMAERFMIDHVAARKPPPPDTTERYAEFLSAAFPRERERTAPLRMVDATETQLLDALAMFAKLKAAEKRMAPLLRKCANEIKSAIGEGAGLEGEWGKVTWLANKSSVKMDWQALARELMPHAPADLVAALTQRHTTTTAGIRPLRPTWAGALRYDVDRLEVSLDRLVASLDSDEEG